VGERKERNRYWLREGGEFGVVSLLNFVRRKERGKERHARSGMLHRERGKKLCPRLFSSLSKREKGKTKTNRGAKRREISPRPLTSLITPNSFFHGREKRKNGIPVSMNLRHGRRGRKKKKGKAGPSLISPFSPFLSITRGKGTRSPPN